MTLESPAGLLLLAAAPLAAWLLLRRVRRRERPAAAFFLLRDLVDALPLLPRSHLLRRRLQALLFVAALTCVGLAGGGPVLGDAGDPSQRVVVLLDTIVPGGDAGARMRSWERLLGTAAQYVQGLRGDDGVIVVRADAGIVGGGLLSPRAAIRAIRREAPSMLPTDPAAAADLATLAAGARGASLVAVATHAPDRWRSLAEARGGAWRVLPVTSPGSAGVNRGLLDVEVRPDFLRPGRVSVFCRVGAFGEGGRQPAELTVSVEGRLLARRGFALGPGESRGEAFAQIDAGTGLLRIELGPADAFPQDNVFLSPLRPGAAVPVLLVSEGNAPLEAALRALPGVRLAVVRPAAAASRPAAAVLVFDGDVPADVTGSVLAVAPPGGLPGAGYRGDAPDPRVVRPDPTHLLLAGVSLEGFRASRVPIYELAAGIEVAARADGHPLVAAGRTGRGARLALLAFDPRETAWSFTPSFPVLIANLVSWLAEEPGGVHSSFRLGDTLPGDLAGSVRGVRGPSGERIDPPGGGWGALRLAEAGRWEIEGRDAGSSGAVFVNVLDERVSAAVTAFEGDGGPSPAVAAPVRPFRAGLRLPLLLAAAALLLLELLVAPARRAGRLP